MEGLFIPAPRAPIGPGFGPASTAAEIITGRDVTRKTAVVTRGYSGIGVETVRAFRSAGANVVVPPRDMAKAMANLADMPDVCLEIMNLLDPGSIDAFAEQFLRDDEKLHILVNNAGIMAPPLERDSRGYSFSRDSLEPHPEINSVETLSIGARTSLLLSNSDEIGPSRPDHVRAVRELFSDFTGATSEIACLGREPSGR